MMTIPVDSHRSIDNHDFALILEAQLDGHIHIRDAECTTMDDAEESNECPPHPAVVGGMCVRCGWRMWCQTWLHTSGTFSMWLDKFEIARLSGKDLTSNKLILVLDLDHTLLNSTRFVDITPEERYLTGPKEALPDAIKANSLYHLESNSIHMITKLRPYVSEFLSEASKLFEMSIYTMGQRTYAKKVADILDPHNVYFNSKVITQEDCTQSHQKSLDVVIGKESDILILDDTEAVWSKHKENLILMERYHFFQSSCKQFGFKCKSLSEQKKDESEDDGALATILKVLQRVHSLYFDQETDLLDQDVRKILKKVRKEVLPGCKIVFSRIFPTKSPCNNHPLWRMAEQLGATCSTELDESVTHVVSTDVGTVKSRWAVNQNKFLVHPRWIKLVITFGERNLKRSFLLIKRRSAMPLRLKSDISREYVHRGSSFSSV